MKCEPAQPGYVIALEVYLFRANLPLVTYIGRDLWSPLDGSSRVYNIAIAARVRTK